ncbi:hypothetical protein [Pelagicoccus albus]|uniref:Uncharacterized protein n=1 Tax=Pelagicoccus albus TaxID=415222 RepID=A0A7X1B6H2_9BACT|nr:hypothetical protein [Pelagicoccus albus]MBC2606578.1 hypothetical protein [Pelagicoccus albus]
MTVTFKEKVYAYKKATKLFHSFVSSDVFCRLFGKWYRVAEQHKDGSWHLHMLVECRDNIRAAFDWDHWSASKELFGKNRGKAYAHLAKCCAKDHPIRVYWQGIVKMSERSKMIGRCQMEPIKSNAEGCGKYLAKYLDKGFVTNRINAKEKRTRVERRRLVAKGGKAIRAASSRLSWVSPDGRRWRGCIGEVATHFGLKDYSEFSKLWGPSWAYRIKDVISYLPFDDYDGARTMRIPMELGQELGQTKTNIPEFSEEQMRKFVFARLHEMRIRKDKSYEKQNELVGGEASFSFKGEQYRWYRSV